jgi:3-methyladenine DNA glycosylase/8-oxoguanine DNA glycosylase
MASGEISQLEVYAVIRSFYGGEMPTTGVRIPRGVIWRQLLNPSSREYKPPEKFPTPHQVAEADFASLRSAGLSTRKAEYSTQYLISS